MTTAAREVELGDRAYANRQIASEPVHSSVRSPGKYSPGGVDRRMRSQNYDVSRYFASREQLRCELGEREERHEGILPRAARSRLMRRRSSSCLKLHWGDCSVRFAATILASLAIADEPSKTNTQAEFR